MLDLLQFLLHLLQSSTVKITIIYLQVQNIIETDFAVLTWARKKSLRMATLSDILQTHCNRIIENTFGNGLGWILHWMNKQETNGVSVVKFITYKANSISAVKAALQKIKVSLFSSSCLLFVLFCVMFLDSCVIGPPWIWDDASQGVYPKK